MIVMHISALPLPIIFKKISAFFLRKNVSANNIYNIISSCFLVIKILLIIVEIELFVIQR